MSGMGHSAEKDVRIREAAQRIADWHLADAEFCIVYEDEDCADMTEDEWRQVHDLIQHSRAVLPSVTPPAKKGGPHSLTDCWCGEHHAREDFL